MQDQLPNAVRVLYRMIRSRRGVDAFKNFDQGISVPCLPIKSAAYLVS
jgi:hypothetical protein